MTALAESAGGLLFVMVACPVLLMEMGILPSFWLGLGG